MRPLRSPRNPFARMVTVGRATNNDAVLSEPSVSKFHADFQETPVLAFGSVAANVHRPERFRELVASRSGALVGPGEARAKG